jgi:hypothetical protein
VKQASVEAKFSAALDALIAAVRAKLEVADPSYLEGEE